MKLPLSCAVLLLMFNMIYCKSDACPLYDIDYYHYDIDKIHEIYSWEECGYLCHITDGCKYWTWLTGLDQYPYECCLKSSNSGIVNKDEHISGDKNCY